MKFMVDNQLPWALARWLSGKGHDAVHVLDRDQGQVADHALWDEAIAEGRIMISKDADFFSLPCARMTVASCCGYGWGIAGETHCLPHW